MPIAGQVKSLAEDIEASYGARVSAVSGIIKETQASLGSFHREHKKMADELRDSLSTNNSGRVSEVRKMRAENVRDLKEMAHKLAEFLSSSEKGRLEEFTTLIGEIKGVVAAIEKDTAETLTDFRSSHREMSEAQREELSSFQKKLERIVREMRAPVIADLKEAKRNWQNLAKVMAAKRAGKPVPTPKAEMGVPKAVKEEAEEAFEKGEMKERVLAVIRAHPGGITLPEIGKALKVAYIRASKPLKELLAGMRVTKRDSEYFPA